MEPEKRFIEATKTFLESWLYKHERQVDLDSLMEIDFNLYLDLDRQSDEFESILARWEKHVAILDKIKTALTKRTIDPTTAAEIHGLTNRQLVYWEKNNLMPFDKEKGKRRRYSVIDISYLLIIRQFQERFNSQPQAIAQIIRPMLENEVLTLSLVRDIIPDRSVCLIYQSEENKAVGNLGIGSQFDLGPEVTMIVSLSSIVDYVLSLAGNIGLRTFKVDGYRYFNFPGQTENLLIGRFFTIHFTDKILNELYRLARQLGNEVFIPLEESLKPIVKPLQDQLFNAAQEYVNQKYGGNNGLQMP